MKNLLIVLLGLGLSSTLFASGFRDYVKGSPVFMPNTKKCIELGKVANSLSTDIKVVYRCDGNIFKSKWLIQGPEPKVNYSLNLGFKSLQGDSKYDCNKLAADISLASNKGIDLRDVKCKITRLHPDRTDMGEFHIQGTAKVRK